MARAASDMAIGRKPLGFFSTIGMVMPSCIVKVRSIIYFVSQSDRLRRFQFVQSFLLFGLLDDLFQQVDVFSEGPAARWGQRAGCERPAVLKRLGHRQVAGLLQCPDV